MEDSDYRPPIGRLIARPLLAAPSTLNPLPSTLYPSSRRRRQPERDRPLAARLRGGDHHPELALGEVGEVEGAGVEAVGRQAGDRLGRLADEARAEVGVQ